MELVENKTSPADLVKCKKRNMYVFMFRNEVQFMVEADTFEGCGRKLADNFQKTKDLFASFRLKSEEEVRETFGMRYEDIFLRVSNHPTSYWCFQMVPIGDIL